METALVFPRLSFPFGIFVHLVGLNKNCERKGNKKKKKKKK